MSILSSKNIWQVNICNESYKFTLVTFTHKLTLLRSSHSSKNLTSKCDIILWFLFLIRLINAQYSYGICKLKRLIDSDRPIKMKKEILQRNRHLEMGSIIMSRSSSSTFLKCHSLRSKIKEHFCIRWNIENRRLWWIKNFGLDEIHRRRRCFWNSSLHCPWNI